MSKNLCPECQTRPIGGGPLDGTWNDREDAKQHKMCLVCLAEAYWTNIHSDYAHSLAEVQEAGKDEQEYDLANCWVCHPELDKSSETYVTRTGTSRLGMVMVVPVRASALDKAATVKAQLAGFRGVAEADGANGVTLKLSKGSKDAKIAVEAHWDFAGRWTGGNVNGKKARNASELLRLVAVLAA